MYKVIFLLGFCLLCAYATAGFLDGFENANTNVDDDDVVKAAEYASRMLSKRFAGKYHHKFAKVLKARKQELSGTTYFMDIIVGQTNCEKKQVDYENVEDCEFRDGISTYKKCTVTVYKDLNGSHKLMFSGCILASKKDL